jgi:hypothetical protein
MAHDKKSQHVELSQPLTAAPMPEYTFQRYTTSSERFEDDDSKKETEARKLDLSGVVLNLS